DALPISSLSNPKVGLFFLAILPTLVPASPTGVDYVLLIAVVLGVLLAYQIVLALTASLAASAMAHRSADFFIEAASALILLIIGIAVIAIPICGDRVCSMASRAQSRPPHPRFVVDPPRWIREIGGISSVHSPQTELDRPPTLRNEPTAPPQRWTT